MLLTRIIIPLLLSLLFVYTTSYSQRNNFKEYTQDTLILTQQNFTKAVAFHLENAVVLIDLNFFLSTLGAEKRGCKKGIRVSKRVLKRDNNNRMLKSGLDQEEKEMVVLKEYYHRIRMGIKSADTIHVYFADFIKVHSRFGDFYRTCLKRKNV